MRRFISILLVVTVNILFIAHAVLPHHHHDGVPHFVFFEEENHHHSGEEGNCCCPEQNADPCGEECALEKEIDVIVEPNDEYTALVPSESFSDQEFWTFASAIISLLSNDSLPDTGSGLRPTPYLISFYSEYVSRACGLRAPPVA